VQAPPTCPICGQAAPTPIAKLVGEQRDAWVLFGAPAVISKRRSIEFGSAKRHGVDNSSADGDGDGEADIASSVGSSGRKQWCHRACVIQRQLSAAKYKKERAGYARAKQMVYPLPGRSQRMLCGDSAKRSGGLAGAHLCCDRGGY
jgi:hypothetical protein